ncbi:MAG: hypothetical protein JNL43_05175 [Flavobacteriales bacterium]|nr:hypothetical protein [Flavobacteriales bacterium]
MKKLIGLALWLLAFLIPFRYAILDTGDLLQEDGSIDNIKGLLSFVVMLGLLFAGYALVDSSGPKPGSEEAHGH